MSQFHYPPRRMVEYQGETLPISHLAARLGMQSSTLCARLTRGMTIEQAIATPVRVGGHRRREVVEPVPIDVAMRALAGVTST